MNNSGNNTIESAPFDGYLQIMNREERTRHNADAIIDDMIDLISGLGKPSLRIGISDMTTRRMILSKLRQPPEHDLFSMMEISRKPLIGC
jgi:hypothetical protein